MRTKSPLPEPDEGTSSPVERVFRVIELAAEMGSISVADIVDTLGIPRPTAHRIVSGLEQFGYLQKMMNRGSYAAAPRLVNLATNPLGSTIVYAPLHTALADLARRTGETCSLGVVSSGEVVYIASAIGNSPLTLQFQAGQRTPLYCTSTGRIFLASLDEMKLKAFLATGPWQAITPHTITDPIALREELVRVRAQGFATNDSEFIVGVAGIAVPVKNLESRVVAALTVSAPKSRKSLDDLRELVPALRSTAARIARVL